MKKYELEVYYLSDVVKFIEILAETNGILNSVVRDIDRPGLFGSYKITYLATDEIDMVILC